jgi:hypothetical protein
VIIREVLAALEKKSAKVYLDNTYSKNSVPTARKTLHQINAV